MQSQSQGKNQMKKSYETLKNIFGAISIFLILIILNYLSYFIS